MNNRPKIKHLNKHESEPPFIIDHKIYVCLPNDGFWFVVAKR